MRPALAWQSDAMMGWLRPPSLALLATGLVLGPPLAPPVGGQAVGGGAGPVERVTTDTPEYCAFLLNRLRVKLQDHSRPYPEEVSALSDQGERMCDHGEVPAGILRLRRAIRIVMSPAPER